MQTYDDTNVSLLVGDGETVVHNGVVRYLSSKPKGPWYNLRSPSLKDVGILVLTQAQCDEITAAKTTNRAQLSDAACLYPSHDQQSTSYCWCNSVAGAGTLLRQLQGLPLAILSAASIGCPLTGYSDQGGDPADALDQLCSVGAVPVTEWPNTGISKQYDTANVQADLANYQCTAKTAALDPSNMTAEVASCLALGLPITVAYNWWSHSVLLLDYIQMSPFTILFRNSWGDSFGSTIGQYGGFAQLSGRHAVPDEAIAMVSMEQYEKTLRRLRNLGIKF